MQKALASNHESTTVVIKLYLSYAATVNCNGGAHGGLGLVEHITLRPTSAAWYHKREVSLSDAIAAVQRFFYAPNLSMSRHDRDGVKIPTALWERLTETLCYAA